MAEIDTARYGEASQILYMIDTLGKLEAAGTIRPAEKAELDRLRQMTAPAQDTVNRTRAGYRGVGQGVTFNTADEVGAYLSSLGGGDYDKALETARTRNDLAKLNYPDEYNGGKTAGAGMTMVLPVGSVSAGLNAAKAGALGITALGALEGATVASAPDFFEGEGGFTNRVANIDPKTAAIGALLGGGAGYFSGKGQAQDLADYKDWIAKNTPADTESVALLNDMKYFRPSEQEDSAMFTNPTVHSDAYLFLEKEAKKLRKAGASRADIIRQTGMLDMPVNALGYTGPAERRSFALVDQHDLEKLRPDAANNFGLDIQYKNLPKGYHGYHDPVNNVIAINKNDTPEIQEITKNHELGHGNLEAGELEYPLVGGSVEAMRSERLKLIDDIKSQIRYAPPFTASQLKKQLEELQATTAKEMYYNNFGEQLVRASSEKNPYSIVRLSPKEVLNPNINKKIAPQRIADAMKTSLLSETKPYMNSVSKGWDNINELVMSGKIGRKLTKGRGLRPITSDRFGKVPLDLDKSVVADRGYARWLELGKPWGNYTQWLNSLP